MKQAEAREGCAERWAAAARPPRPSALTGALWGSPPQALMDDTEDVSLDLGAEEELALQKARIRILQGGLSGSFELSKPNSFSPCLHRRGAPAL